jgi:hypothetical protein
LQNRHSHGSIPFWKKNGRKRKIVKTIVKLKEDLR